MKALIKALKIRKALCYRAGQLSSDEAFKFYMEVEAAGCQVKILKLTS